ncbi:hypothetical protein FGG08_003569 [Glutinoglossum americanum]|uniref:Exocyst complex component EXO84 n=1 Tax=Glutinoglossum americanum TaxID=1670608 RepID=A0A9P8L3E3_9PEZI|nr:hypothetical protein FGG08_003569 [Glutinoglossum americanum]
MPAIPNQFSSSLPPSLQISQGRAGPSSSGPVSVDLNALRDPNFKPEKYVSKVLSQASEQEIREYQASLQKMRNRTSIDLQQNVYQNRTQFIKISKEAEKLKGEMRTLRSLMSELKANTNALKQATAELGPSSQMSAFDPVNIAIRKQANRSSVADLTAMWNTQLQALWKNVEGSQKFLPAVPGRHVIRDSPHWVELNAATWKSRRAMHMFLLNDHLLVASRKKKRMNSSASATNSQKQQPVPSKLVAERCWPLTDIEMVDLSSGLGPAGAAGAKREREYVVNAINVRVGQESFTYRNEKMDEKVSLLLTFRKAADELRKVLRAETEDGGRIRDSINYFAARDPALFKQPYLMETLTESMSKDRPHVLIEVDGKQQNFRWVENQIDELDIQIALQFFEDAISRVEKMRRIAKGMKGNAAAQDLLNLKIDERAGKLAHLITRQLVDGHSFQIATMRNVSWLTRLGFEDRAREAFLEARSGVIGKRARQCTFEGDLHQYIFQISLVYFTLIKNTVRIYQACFPPPMMSACVKWAKEHVDGFNGALARQLSSVDPRSQTWTDCMERAKEHAKLLVDVGLDFKDLIGKGVEGWEGGAGRE